MTGSNGVKVTIYDPVTDVTTEHDLSVEGYILLTDNKKYYVAYEQHYPMKGTIQFTLRRGPGPE